MKLIVIRGPAGSGKSSVARELHNTATEKTALLPLDLFRVDIAKEQEGAPLITADIIGHAAKRFLDADYTVILEGIFNLKKDYYKDLFADLLQYNQAYSHIYFLEVSLEESINRNSARPKGNAIDEGAIREWYPKSQKSGYKIEKVINTEEQPIEDVVKQIADECDLKLDENNYKKNFMSSI